MEENKTGRPFIDVDYKLIDNYLKAQCDGVGIAAALGVCPDTLYNRIKEKYSLTFSAYAAIKKAEGKEMLRAKQFQSAMEGDKTMLIFLGKQYLDQKDKKEVTATLVNEIEEISDEELNKLEEKILKGENLMNGSKSQ